MLARLAMRCSTARCSAAYELTAVSTLVPFARVTYPAFHVRASFPFGGFDGKSTHHRCLKGTCLASRQGGQAEVPSFVRLSERVFENVAQRRFVICRIPTGDEPR